jgi:hypothetical protein
VIHVCVGDLTQQDEEARIIKYLRREYKKSLKKAEAARGEVMNSKWMSWGSHLCNIQNALLAFGVDLGKEQEEELAASARRQTRS